MMTYQEWLGTGKPTNSKHELRFNCHQCDDTKYKLYWNTQRGIGHCFRCNFAGNAVKLCKQLGLEYHEKPVSLRKKNSLHRGKQKPRRPARLRSGGARADGLVPPGASVFTSVQGLSYLLGRKMRPSEIRKYEIRFLAQFPPRVVLPVRSLRGRVVGWTGRAVLPGIEPKYKFPAGFSAARHLFGAEFVAQGDEVVVVEGPFDQIRYGDGAVATFGKHMSAYQRKLLLKLKPRVVTVLWDRDAMPEAVKLAGELSRLVKVRLATQSIPLGKDPGSLPRVTLRRIVQRTPLYKSYQWLKNELAFSLSTETTSRTGHTTRSGISVRSRQL